MLHRIKKLITRENIKLLLDLLIFFAFVYMIYVHCYSYREGFIDGYKAGLMHMDVKIPNRSLPIPIPLPSKCNVTDFNFTYPIINISLPATP